MNHDTPKRRGPKPGSGKGATTARRFVSIRLDQVDFWDALPNRSAFVQKAIDKEIKKLIDWKQMKNSSLAKIEYNPPTGGDGFFNKLLTNTPNP